MIDIDVNLTTIWLWTRYDETFSYNNFWDKTLRPLPFNRPLLLDNFEVQMENLYSQDITP
jgi:hypothetical protein